SGFGPSNSIDINKNNNDNNSSDTESISSTASTPTTYSFTFLPGMIEIPRPEAFSLPPTFALDIEIPHFALRRRNAVVEAVLECPLIF
ncbi:7823_t:CDS:1, partial [Ambispora gerdemannii]